MKLAEEILTNQPEEMKEALKDFIDKLDIYNQNDKGVIEYLYTFILFGVASWTK